jgi:C-methyltransferase-like protein
VLREQLMGVLGDLRRDGKRVAAYGAAAKGTTMLNACGIGTDLVEYVVDRNPHKIGRLMPGTHQPIRPVETLLEDRPDAVLLLVWNIADEVLAQQEAYRAAGGLFVVPVPEPRIV